MLPVWQPLVVLVVVLGGHGERGDVEPVVPVREEVHVHRLVVLRRPQPVRGRGSGRRRLGGGSFLLGNIPTLGWYSVVSFQL